MRISAVLAFVLIILFLNVATKSMKVNAAPDYNNFYSTQCLKHKLDPLTAYICGLRSQNQQLTSQVQSLQNQVAQLQSNQPAAVNLFDEEFNGTQLDSSKWVANPNGGIISVNNGVLNLSAPSDGSPYVPPLVQVKIPDVATPFYNIPSDPSVISFNWRMKTSQNSFPLSLIFTNGNMRPDQSGNLNFNGGPFITGVWGNFLLYNYEGNHIIGTVPQDLNYHNYQVTFLGNYFHYYVDNSLIAFGKTNTPYAFTSVFIGAPFTNTITSDSNLSIDYLKITAPSFIPRFP